MQTDDTKTEAQETAALYAQADPETRALALGVLQGDPEAKRQAQMEERVAYYRSEPVYHLTVSPVEEQLILALRAKRAIQCDWDDPATIEDTRQDAVEMGYTEELERNINRDRKAFGLALAEVLTEALPVVLADTVKTWQIHIDKEQAA